MTMTETKNKTKPVTPENMRAMALSVIRYLNRHDMFSDINIYAGGMHYSDTKHPGQELNTGLVKTVRSGPGRPTCTHSHASTTTRKR